MNAHRKTSRNRLIPTAIVIAVLVAAVAATSSGPVVVADSLRPGERECFAVRGTPGEIAIVNLTPVRGSGTGYGQLISSDVAEPSVAANVNYTEGSIDPNVAVAPIGDDGQVCFVNSPATSVQLVADQIGQIDGSSFTPADSTGAPVRRVDTRSGRSGDRLNRNRRLCFAVSGEPDDAAIVNLTPVRGSGTGYGQLISSDVAEPPVAANVNYTEGSIDPNVAVAPIGDDGQVCFVNGPTASVDLVADQIGAIAADSYLPATTTGAPSRRVDTRVDGDRRRIGASQRSCFAVDGEPGDAAIVNLTPIRATDTGYGQLVSSDATDTELVANVNYTAGSIDPNIAIAKIGVDGQVCFVNGPTAQTHFTADHIGTIAASSYVGLDAPRRVLDTRLTASRRDLVLGANAIGAARFGGNDSETISYVASGLGDDPTVDRQKRFPIRSDFDGVWEDSNSDGFTHPYSRETCWTNDLCLYFGGESFGDLAFVGWSQVGGNRSLAMSTRDGITIGSRWSDHLATMNVHRGGCYSTGYGTTREIDLVVSSTGLSFTGPGFTPQLPDPRDVTVLALDAGDQYFYVFADC